MSENDFFQINGNSYRGSRYANFAGAGVDPQGNVSTVAIEGNQNNQAQTPSLNTPQISNEVREVSNRGVELGAAAAPPITAPDSLGKQATNLAIGAALPAGANVIGGQVGANIAAGAPTFGNIGTAISDRVSAGLLGSSASGQATNAALSSMGGKFGPATSSSVSSASRGANVGGSVGAGIGTAAATLLTGGSIKDAAFAGTGAAVGTYIGASFGPIGAAVGSFVGSTIGSFVGKAFGGGIPRVTASAILRPNESGQLSVEKATSKGAPKAATIWGQSVNDSLNKFSQALGLKYTNRFKVETNLGKKDKGTFLNDVRVSSKAGDVAGASLAYLKNTSNYTTSGDAELDNFWKDALGGATSLEDLGGKVDSFFSSRSLAAAPPPNAQSNITRRQGDKYATFFG